MAAQFYPCSDEEEDFNFDDPYLGLGDDKSLFDQDSWWKGPDYDALADDPDWTLSFQGQRFLEHQQEERNRQIDAQEEREKDRPKSRWELLMEEEDEEEEILDCMSQMFQRAEAEHSAKSKNKQ